MKKLYETITQERIDALEDWEYEMMLEATGYTEELHRHALSLVTKSLWKSNHKSSRGQTARELRLNTGLGEREVIVILNYLYTTRAIVVSERMRGLPGRPTKYFHLVVGVLISHRDPDAPARYGPSYEPDLGGFVRCRTCDVALPLPSMQHITLS